ncbi:hypothetical protein ACFWDN_13060 [Micromonospora chalcea]
MTDEVREAISKLLAEADFEERGIVEQVIKRAGLKPKPRRITTQDELAKLADELGVRLDWHEPDEKGVTARLEGYNLDNAGSWPKEDGRPAVEMCVIIKKGEDEVAAVNIATLLGWASADRRI